MMDTSLSCFLRFDRRWPRRLRIDHARMQLSKATSESDKEFWRAVLEANED